MDFIRNINQIFSLDLKEYQKENKIILLVMIQIFMKQCHQKENNV